MRYIQPQLTGTFAALSTIHGSKHDVSIEISQELTGTPAYEADE